ncbi:DMT family transporter [Rhodocaloribacter litoris]|uniref:DMT family transporter n=1 Tax=Rhodocaloribacter litoris TaxID=2558931 RepID=UPI001421A9A8|nr:DMT family transporter [Rhodocaloribacter litoris]QXD15557.1 DMT family transporter [Rhodocaloribacter litoris]
MTDTRASGWKTDAMLLFVTLVWGCNFPVIKAVLAVMPAHAMNAVRLLISALVLGGYYAVQGRRQGTPLLAPLRQAPGMLLALGLLGYFLYQVAFIVGLDHTAAGSAAIIMASVPLWSALVGHTFGFERLRRLGWAGLLVTLVGTALIVVFGPRTVDFGGGVLFGNVVMVGAAVCWGCYTALNRPVLRRVSPLALSLFGLLFSLPLLFLVALPSFDEIAWGRVNGWTWAALLYSGGLSTGLAPVLWSASVHRVGAAHTTAFGNLVPFIALFAGFFFLDEPINLAQLLGGGLIIAGIMLVRRVRGTARPPARV